MIEIFLLCVVLLLTLYWTIVRRSALLLPGPKGLPLVGYGPFLGPEPYKKYMELADTYGPIFKVQLGTREWVVLNNKELIHEAFVKNSRYTTGRVHNMMIDALAKGKAPAIIDGPLWRKLRDFDIKALKSYGTAKLEANVREEAEHLCLALAEKKGSLCDCEHSIMTAVSNVTCHVTMGRRYDYKDPHYQDILDALIIFTGCDKKTEHFGAIMRVELLRFFPGYRETYKSVESTFVSFRNEIRRRLTERKKTFNENDLDDVMDRFLSEIRRRANENETTFTEDHLVFVLQDMISASSDTTTNVIRWCIVGLSTNPTYQDKMYKEITSVTERRGYISMEDQPNMPFTRAYIQEILRFCTPLPLNLPHRATEDFILGGYKIPSNTPIITNIWAVHRNPLLFENPDAFLPERFLDSEGNFVPSEDVIAFSLGNRRCLGELVGRMEVLLFLTHIVSTFKILPDETGTAMTMDEGMLSITYAPRKFCARFVTRKSMEE